MLYLLFHNKRNLLFQSTIGKVYSSKLKNRNPPPKHDRFHYTANAASKKRNIEGEDDRRFVAITKRVNEQFNSKQVSILESVKPLGLIILMLLFRKE